MAGFDIYSMALLFLAFMTVTVHALSVSKYPAPSVKNVPSTCPSRSLNYITQTLPQQCLTSSWASRSNGQENATKTGLRTSSGPNPLTPGTESVTALNPSLLTGVYTESRATSSQFVNVSTSTSPQEGLSAPSAVEATGQPKSSRDDGQPVESDSPLDNVNFLSFEEWKRQNLAKAGQSAENLGTKAGVNEPRRRPGGINNALDSLGEDTEIEIDFRGFVNPDASPVSDSSAFGALGKESSMVTGDNRDQLTREEIPGVQRKSKDAGKTCKERSNYASFDCAATMLKTNPESKGSNAVLVENRDSYMLNICAAKNKFFIVELCDDILIDTVVLANFEFFSSMFRTFRVSVSDRFPVKLDKWRDLGTYEARNSREVQAFLVENPLIWARYLRIEYLTHYGNEYYCPISLLRVHGTTMMEEFNHDLKRAGTDEDSDHEVADEEASYDPKPIHVSPEARQEQTQGNLRPVVQKATQDSYHSKVASADAQSTAHVDSPVATFPSDPEIAHPQGFSSYHSSISKQMENLLSAVTVCNQSEGLTDTTLVSVISTAEPDLSLEANWPATSTQVLTMSNPTTHQVIEKVTTAGHGNFPSSSEASDSALPTLAETNPPQNDSESATSSNQTSATVSKTQTSSTQPPHASPTTQESFFKSVHKRLQLLEANSTLSLQYIEEQSRILRDAFSKVEKRQLAKTTTFLETLNNTVLTELRDFRNQYDQIWQSTVLELSSQREQSQQEVSALSARLSLLADEIVSQKRIIIFQFILILLCLGLAMFSRSSSSATYLDIPPMMQNAINKSSVKLSRYTPYLDTPSVSPSSTRPSSKNGLLRGLSHLRGLSYESQADGARDGTKSPSIEYSPPTPTSSDPPEDHGDQVSGGDEEERLEFSFPHAEERVVRQTKSSPATPSGQRDKQRTSVEGILV